MLLYFGSKRSEALRDNLVFLFHVLDVPVGHVRFIIRPEGNSSPSIHVRANGADKEIHSDSTRFRLSATQSGTNVGPLRRSEGEYKVPGKYIK